MGGAFSAPTNNLIEEAKLFYGNKRLAYAVELWEKGENNTIVLSDGTNAPGTLPMKGEKFGKTVFQNDLQESLPIDSTMKIKTPEDGGTLIYETTGDLACKAFMPAGFRGGPTPNTMNPYRTDMGNPTGETPQNCATSWGHIVVIPVNHKIYNAITLTEEHLPLLAEMDRVGKVALKAISEGGVDMVGSLRWAMAQDSTIKMNDGRSVSSKLHNTEFVDDEAFLNCQSEGVDSVQDMVRDTTESTFHVGRAASVGYLHLHVRPTCFDLISKIGMDEQASEKGYIKQTLLDDVVSFVNSDEYATIKAQSEMLECESEPEPEGDDSDDDDGSALVRQASHRRSGGGLSRQGSRRD